METLTAKRIVLREFDSDDAVAFAQAVQESGESVGKWLPWWKADFTQDEARLWFASCSERIAVQSAFDIGIFREDDGLLIGSVAINRIDAVNRSGSIGYWIRESQQGKGYCSEAVNRIKAFGFNELRLARLEIVVLVENLASRQVAENCGAKLECIAEQRSLHQGRPSAAAVYSLLR